VELIPARVECHSGHRADETPRRFNAAGHETEIAEVIDRWYQGERDPEWPAAAYFKVRGEDGRTYLLKHDEESDSWYEVRS
jgi:hypothetical protein